MSHSSFVCTQLNGSGHYFQTRIIPINFNHLFAHSEIVSSVAIWDWQFHMTSVIWLQLNGQRVLFNQEIGPKQIPPLRVRVDLELIAMNEYSIFSKIPGLEPHYQMVGFLLYPEHTLRRVSYPSTEMHSALLECYI